MSHSELERLARIRMQLTGETLERAMAVLEGHTAEPEPTLVGGQADHDDHGDSGDQGEPADHAAPSADQDVDQNEPRPGGHLRGL